MPAELVTAGCVCADVTVRPVEELPPPGTLVLVPGLTLHLGGLAGVTAAVYARLGGQVSFLGRLGNDTFGDAIIGLLGRYGVDTARITRDGSAHTSASIVAVRGDGSRSFLHHAGTNACLCEADITPEAVAGARWFHCGGPGILPGIEGAPMGRVFARLRAAGLGTSLDTCYDGSGRWGELLSPCLPHCDIVFTSMKEAVHYTRRDTPEAIAAALLEGGAGMAVVKLGAGGMYARTAEAEVRVAAHQAQVVDTTGAGDAACGGFLFAHLRGDDLQRCARMANAAGALTVQAMGGAEGVTGLAALEAMMESATCCAG